MKVLIIAAGIVSLSVPIAASAASMGGIQDSDCKGHQTLLAEWECICPCSAHVRKCQ